MNDLPTTTGASPARGGRCQGWARLCFAAAAVAGVLLWTASSAAAATMPAPAGRVTFGIEPASAASANGRPNFSFGATPGALLFDHVAALNYSSVPLSLQLYATDAVETTGGGFGLLPATAMPTGVGSWVSIPPSDSTVDVPPETATGPGQFVVPLTVRIPDNATPGDHVGGILVSLRTVGKNSSGQNVVLEQRIGTRVFIQVSGKLVPKVTLTDVQAAYHGTINPIGKGKVRVSYVITNAGNVDLAVGHQSVSVSGVLGSRDQVSVASIPLLLPGATVTESSMVTGVWPQILVHESVTARPVVLAASNVSSLASVSSTALVWAIPWTLIVLVILVAVVLFLGTRARSRARVKRRSVVPPKVVDRQKALV